TGSVDRNGQDRGSDPERLATLRICSSARVHSRRRGVTTTILAGGPTALPLVLSWQVPHEPLPLREVRMPRRSRARSADLAAPPWHETGTIDRPFDFGHHVRRLCTDIVRRCEELQHIDVSRLLFGMTQARTGQPHGLQARVTPLRFRHGRLTRRRAGTVYQV